MATSSDTPSSSTSLEAPSSHAVEREIFVLISIAVVAIMFVGMVGLLYWRERPAPSALLILRVPAAFDGAVATVDTKYVRDISPVVTTLQGDKEVRVPLPPGEYIVRIEHPGLKDSREKWHQFTLGDYSYYPVILQNAAATRPATRNSSRR